MTLSPKSLRGRLALFYALVLSLVLVAFAGVVYAVFEAQEAKEPPEVEALEEKLVGPDPLPQHLLYALLAALPVAGAVAVGGALFVSRRGLRPLDDVVATATRVGAESLHQRIPERAGAADELAQLVKAVNGMLERLDRSVAGMRRFTADASHELRTPIAALMGELEVTLRRPRSPDELRSTLESTLERLGDLSRLVELLLILARSDAGGLPLDAQPVNLVELAQAAVEPYEALMQARHIRLSWDTDGAVEARADRLWTGRAIANLVDNACKFTPDGGEVRVAVRRQGGRALVTVHDSGPGIVDGERERVFERFYRGDAARAGKEGAGLGLPLARDIARSQGGDVRAVASEQGAAFVLELPSG